MSHGFKIALATISLGASFFTGFYGFMGFVIASNIRSMEVLIFGPLFLISVFGIIFYILFITKKKDLYFWVSLAPLFIFVLYLIYTSFN